MTSAEEARRIVDELIASMPQMEPLQLADETIERPSHWVFLLIAGSDGGEDDDSLAGSVPIAVAKDDGEVTWLDARTPIEDQLP